MHHCETGSHSSPFTVNLQTEVETLKMATSAHRFPPSRHAHNKGGEEPMFGYKSGAFICGSGYHDLFTPCSNRTKTATTASAEICQGEMPTGNHVGWVFLRHRDVDGAAGHDWTPRHQSALPSTNTRLRFDSLLHRVTHTVRLLCPRNRLLRLSGTVINNFETIIFYCRCIVKRGRVCIYVGWVWIIKVIEVPT